MQLPIRSTHSALQLVTMPAIHSAPELPGLRLAHSVAAGLDKLPVIPASAGHLDLLVMGLKAQ